MAKKARTHKMKKQGKLLSIPQLRKSFDHIDEWVESHVRKGHVKELVPAFQAEWKKTFHREVDASAAEAYLSLKQHSAPRVTRKHRQSGGGAALQGAPLDYSTRPGVYGVYGNFPEYVSSGLRFYNDINQDSLTAQCGKENITPDIPASMGSNEVAQKGGRRRSRKYKTRKQKGGAQPSLLQTAAAVTDVMVNRPFPASSPPTAAYVASMAPKGVDVSVPTPGDTKYTPQPYDPAVIKSTPAALQVNIPATIRSSLVA
jgi:hypothetical protein